MGAEGGIEEKNVSKGTPNALVKEKRFAFLRDSISECFIISISRRSPRDNDGHDGRRGESPRRLTRDWTFEITLANEF
jgi:hypothetical protein